MRLTLFVPEPVKADVWREREHVVVELEGLDEVEVVQEIIRKLLQAVGAQVKDLQGPLQTLEGTRGDRAQKAIGQIQDLKTKIFKRSERFHELL
jgi:hypothetical protein